MFCFLFCFVFFTDMNKGTRTGCGASVLGGRFGSDLLVL